MQNSSIENIEPLNYGPASFPQLYQQCPGSTQQNSYTNCNVVNNMSTNFGFSSFPQSYQQYSSSNRQRDYTNYNNMFMGTCPFNLPQSHERYLVSTQQGVNYTANQRYEQPQARVLSQNQMIPFHTHRDVPSQVCQDASFQTTWNSSHHTYRHVPVQQQSILFHTQSDHPRVWKSAENQWEPLHTSPRQGLDLVRDKEVQQQQQPTATEELQQHSQVLVEKGEEQQQQPQMVTNETIEISDGEENAEVESLGEAEETTGEALLAEVEAQKIAPVVEEKRRVKRVKKEYSWMTWDNTPTTLRMALDPSRAPLKLSKLGDLEQLEKLRKVDARLQAERSKISFPKKTAGAVRTKRQRKLAVSIVTTPNEKSRKRKASQSDLTEPLDGSHRLDEPLEDEEAELGRLLHDHMTDIADETITKETEDDDDELERLLHDHMTEMAEVAIENENEDENEDDGNELEQLLHEYM